MYMVHATKIWTWTTQRLASTLCGPHSRYSPAWKSWKSTSQAERFIHKSCAHLLEAGRDKDSFCQIGPDQTWQTAATYVPHLSHYKTAMHMWKTGCRTFWEAACEELPPAKGVQSREKLRKVNAFPVFFVGVHWLAFSLLNLAYALGSSKFTKRRFKTCYAVGSTSKESLEIIGTNQKKNKCRNLATKTQCTQRLLGQKVGGLTVQSATNQEPSCIHSFLLPNPPS